MPPQIALAAAAAAIGGSLTGATLGSILLKVALSVVLSAVTRALTPKPSTPDPTSQNTQTGINVAVQRSDDSHKHVYGITRHAGMFYPLGLSGDNKYLYAVSVIAAHEIDGIVEYWLGDVCITPDQLDANGLVTTGDFANKVRIRPHLGSPNQTADTLLISEVQGLNSNFRFRGLAYVYWRFEYDANKFSSGLPNPSVVMRGKPIIDPRDNMRRFTGNLGLFKYEYLCNEDAGFGAAVDRFEETQNTAQLNICDEMVTTADVVHMVNAATPAADTLALDGDMLKFPPFARVQLTTTGTLPAGLSPATDYWVIVHQFKKNSVVGPRVRLAATLLDALQGQAVDFTDAGTGTHTITQNAEPRYYGGGVLDTARAIGDNLQDMLSGDAGRLVFAGGKIRILPAAWSEPVNSLNAKSDFVAPFSIDTRLPIEESFNAIGGIFYSQLNNWQPVDYPEYSVLNDITKDGGIKQKKDYPLPYTQSTTTAQRVSKIEYKRARQEIAVQGAAKMLAFRNQCGDNITLNSEPDGFVDKAFEVTRLGLSIENDAFGKPALRVPIILRETAEEIFDHESTEDALIDPAPNSVLPDPFTVARPQNLSYSSRLVNTTDGDTLYTLVLGFDQSIDNNVLASPGQVELFYRETGTTVYKPLHPVPGDSTQADMVTATPGASYDLAARFKNTIGKLSSLSEMPGCIVGSSGSTIGTHLDYESVTGSPATFLDYGAVNTAPTTFLDYEAVL